MITIFFLHTQTQRLQLRIVVLAIRFLICLIFILISGYALRLMGEKHNQSAKFNRNKQQLLIVIGYL